MARVTVEDCLEKLDNRFELVLVAGKPPVNCRPVARNPAWPGKTTNPPW
jgi:hypothetical protein